MSVEFQQSSPLKERLAYYFKRFTDPETYQLMISSVIEAKKAQVMKCYHCRSRQVVRHGKYKDVQRYKCKECNRTFTDLTGTPIHRTHHPRKWMKFLECMIEGYSLRRSAICLGVSHVTLFHWRHKLIRALRLVQGEKQEKGLALEKIKATQRHSFIYVREAMFFLELSYADQGSFISWIRPFDRIGSRYWERYVSWYHFVQEEKNQLNRLFDSMTNMFVSTCSIRLHQTYKNLRLSS